MRIVVLSDTHGDHYHLEQAVASQPKADLFIHLGDGERDLEEIAALFPEKKFEFVSGNCDFGSQTPHENELMAGGKRIFYTHGHQYHVKYGISGILDEGRRRKADIVLFGHTHVPLTFYEDGLYLMNPGSLGHPVEGKPTYGVVDITKGGGVVLNIVEV